MENSFAEAGRLAAVRSETAPLLKVRRLIVMAFPCDEFESTPALGHVG
jgi:hypothetical protein